VLKGPRDSSPPGGDPSSLAQLPREPAHSRSEPSPSRCAKRPAGWRRGRQRDRQVKRVDRRESVLLLIPDQELEPRSHARIERVHGEDCLVPRLQSIPQPTFSEECCMKSLTRQSMSLLPIAVAWVLLGCGSGPAHPTPLATPTPAPPVDTGSFAVTSSLPSSGAIRGPISPFGSRSARTSHKCIGRSIFFKAVRSAWPPNRHTRRGAMVDPAPGTLRSTRRDQPRFFRVVSGFSKTAALRLSRITSYSRSLAAMPSSCSNRR